MSSSLSASPLVSQLLDDRSVDCTRFIFRERSVQFVVFGRCPPGPERSSQHLPLESKHNVDHFKAAGDFFQDAMVLPELVQLPVALRAKMQWVASPAPNKTRRTS